jgi:hypothetical protein
MLKDHVRERAAFQSLNRSFLAFVVRDGPSTTNTARTPNIKHVQSLQIQLWHLTHETQATPFHSFHHQQSSHKTATRKSQPPRQAIHLIHRLIERTQTRHEVLATRQLFSRQRDGEEQ